MTENRLTHQRVEEIFMGCLFSDDEDKSNMVVVEGVVMTVGFHPDRLESHRADVIELLSQLPDEFHSSSGGGWTLLNACVTKDGVEWTGDQMTVDNLFILGMGLGVVSCLLPREVWSALPGGVPYYMVIDPVSEESISP